VRRGLICLLDLRKPFATPHIRCALQRAVVVGRVLHLQRLNLGTVNGSEKAGPSSIRYHLEI
jgi:hypothetical protein